MKQSAWLGALALTTLLTTQTALAQQASPPSGGAEGQGLQLQAKSLMGSTVRSQDGKDIGKITNLMIDPKDGKVAAVVVNMGGRMGMGGQEITVPWDAVQVGRDQQSLVVTMQQSQLPQAPGKQPDGGSKQNSQQKQQ